MKKFELLHFTVAKNWVSIAEQFVNFVSSNWFPAKSVKQSRVEQSQFEQFTPTRKKELKYKELKLDSIAISNTEELYKIAYIFVIRKYFIT